MSPEQIVKRLVARRAAAGLSQAELARLIGTQQSAVSELETGHVSNPTLRTVCRWANAVGLRVVLVERS